MLTEYNVTELYREIGRTFKELGADRVFLLRSRKYPNRSGMALELALDGYFDKARLEQECARRWPELEIQLQDLNEVEDLQILNEAVEDGIML